jgi:death-on-curing protein
MDLQTLSAEDLIQIHQSLVRDFADDGDPIVPDGVKSMPLLESAAGRQLVGYDRRLKYPDPIRNAATLAYGVCCNHAFHNGNKRTALVAMLVHLDRNRMSLFEVNQAQLYSMILEVANHTIGLRKERLVKSETARRDSDEEVSAIAEWIKRNSDKLTRGEKPITYRRLRAILQSFDSIDIVRWETRKEGFWRRERRARVHVTTIPYPGDGKTVPLNTIKFVRNICRLREEHGVDSSSFYDNVVVIDAFINRYRTILRRLANK